MRGFGGAQAPSSHPIVALTGGLINAPQGWNELSFEEAAAG